jgi:hypothetical protein
VYDDVYRENVEVIRRWFAANAPNVHPVGRNGMHKYNNQDHSMYTAMLTVENIHGAGHDIWAVNVEEEYHEVDADGADRPSTGRDAPVVPRRPLASSVPTARTERGARGAPSAPASPAVPGPRQGGGGAG